MATDVLIIDAVRSPIGRSGGALTGLDSAGLLTQTIAELFGRNDIDPADVDDILIGSADHHLTGAVRSGLPATSIRRLSRSSQRALRFAAHGIRGDLYDLVIVGGVETVCRAAAYDSGRAACSTASGRSLGSAADEATSCFGLSRSDLDEYAARSHRRAAACALAGDFARELVPVEVPAGERSVRVTADDSIRSDTTPGALAELEPCFRGRGRSAASSITAGNSSHPADGASALLVASCRVVRSLGLPPRARLHAMSTTGPGSRHMPAGPIAATAKILAAGKVRTEFLDHVEVDEVFAGLPLAWQQRYDVNPYLVNPRGGSIALGNPVGASGCRLITTMINALEATGGRYGLQAMYEADGLASATLIERI
jgi:acetyl-CoA acetyltransferase family protein